MENEFQMTMTAARLEAQRIANREGIVMVVGWQQNDVTGMDEPGYCPRLAVGPAFVHTITETFRPVAS